MSSDLRESYNYISKDYLRKKRNPWRDFVEYLGDGLISGDIVVDIGSANGRNLNLSSGFFNISLDLSFDLLKGYVGPQNSNKIQSALPKLPFRKNCTNDILLIAVIHHFDTLELRNRAISEVVRIQNKGKIIISVWRKWRKGVREEIINRLRRKEDTYDLYNVYRPWKGSTGITMATRFYHYFTFKELRELGEANDLKIVKYARSGGKLKDANFFCTFIKSQELP